MAKTTMLVGRSQVTVYAKEVKVGEIVLLRESFRIEDKDGRGHLRTVRTPMVRIESSDGAWFVPLKQPLHGTLGKPVKLDTHELMDRPRRVAVVVDL